MFMPNLKMKFVAPSFSIFTLCIFSLFLVGAQNATAKSINLKIGCLESPEGPNTQGWKTFEQYVESASNGRINVDIHPSSQLGNSEKLLEGLKLGTQKMAQGDESITGAYDPMKVWFIPYLFSDEYVQKKFFESDFFKRLNDKMADDLGVRALSAAPYGFYNFINKKRKINELSDMKGLKLRTLPNSQLTIKTWDSLGASATPVSWEEIYTSIKTGVIDGLGHTLTIMVDQKYYEVAKNVTLDMSMGCANLYLINEDFYQSLSDKDKKIIKKGAQIGASTEFGIATYRNRVASVDKLEDEDVEIVALSEKNRQEFKEAAHKAVLPWVREKAGDEIVDEALATIEEIEESSDNK